MLRTGTNKTESKYSCTNEPLSYLKIKEDDKYMYLSLDAEEKHEN